MKKDIAPGRQTKTIQNEFATDLTIAFKLFNADALDLISQAEEKKWTIQQLEQQLMRI